jgi:hypothetical protein
MNIPNYTYPAGTRAGTVIRHNGSYVDKTYCYLDKDDNFRRSTVRSYNQPVWYWTGYRWIPYGTNNATETKRDTLRAAAGRKVINNEWR